MLESKLLRIAHKSASALVLVLLADGCAAMDKAPMASPSYPASSPEVATAGSAREESAPRAMADAAMASPAAGAMPARPAAPPSPKTPGPAGPARETPHTGAANAKGAPETASPQASAAAMVIYQGDVGLLVEPERTAASIDAVIDAAESVGGMLGNRTDTTVQVRVPSAHFREALAKIEKLGEVTHRSVTAEDVSAEYHDAEVRLQNLRATRQRLQEFLARAANIPDTLTVERELERIAMEIDRLEGRMRFLKERAAFSVVSVTISAKPKPQTFAIVPPPPPPGPRVLDLPVPWISQLGIDQLLNLR